MRKVGEPVEEFLKIKSKHDLINGCIEWIGYISNGYGTEPLNYWFKQFKVNRAHQLSYKVERGEYDKKKWEISHKCHNKRCINIDHLELNTRKGNIYEDITNKNNKKMYVNGNIEDLVTEFSRGESIKYICNKYKVSKDRLKVILSSKKYAKYTFLDEVAWEPYKLRKKDYEEIKRLREQGEKLKDIAKKMNCSESMICRVCKGNRGKRILSTPNKLI